MALPVDGGVDDLLRKAFGKPALFTDALDDVANALIRKPRVVVALILGLPATGHQNSD